VIDYEQKLSVRLLDAMSAAQDSLTAQGQQGSARCIERALDELDTASAAEIARMLERNRRGWA
jgi:hypothetical protein